MSEGDEARQILLRAAEIIEERGWTRGHFAKSGRVCVVRALDLARGGNGILGTEAVLRRYLGVDNLVTWNDAQKSRQVVVKTMRQAAAS